MDDEQVIYNDQYLETDPYLSLTDHQLLLLIHDKLDNLSMRLTVIEHVKDEFVAALSELNQSPTFSMLTKMIQHRG